MLVHLLAILAIVISAIPVIVKLAIAAAVFFSLAYNLKDAQTVDHLIWRAGNHWIIGDDPDHHRKAHLTGIDFLSRWLVIITLQEHQRRKKRYIIPCDALSTDTFRLMRVRLRIEGHGLLNPEEQA